MTKKIVVLPGDGIGPEIVAEAVKILEAFRQEGLDVSLVEQHMMKLVHRYLTKHCRCQSRPMQFY